MGNAGDKVGGFFQDVFHEVEKPVNWVYNEVLKPGEQKVENVVNTVYNDVKGGTTAIINEGGKVVDAGVGIAQQTSNSVNNLLSSPIVLIGGAAVLLILLKK